MLGHLQTWAIEGCTHHSGMLSSSMRSLLYGMPFSSSVSIVLWENGPASTHVDFVERMKPSSHQHALPKAVQESRQPL